MRRVTRNLRQKWAGRRGSPLTLRDQTLQGHSKPYEHAPGARGAVADNSSGIAIFQTSRCQHALRLISLLSVANHSFRNQSGHVCFLVKGGTRNIRRFSTILTSAVDFAYFNMSSCCDLHCCHCWKAWELHLLALA